MSAAMLSDSKNGVKAPERKRMKDDEKMLQEPEGHPRAGER